MIFEVHTTIKCNYNDQFSQLRLIRHYTEIYRKITNK